jgi:Mg-chelatase subunit ChlI
MTFDRSPYPFTAVVGQEPMKLALILNAVNPLLAGVLIRGEKGTAKSTVVRALAALLPEIEVVEGCPFGCEPDLPDRFCDECRGRTNHVRARRRPRLETLPLGVTEDRLLGSIDLEHALKRGERRFEPGLLARSNRGVLYVDEVNLLEDHIVDVLLDAAAMGVNVVEREGVSHRHPARFVLVGTMNPEEGDLRPQLLDRFGLCVDVESVEDVTARTEIIARGLDYERDPRAFCTRFQPEEISLGRRIAEARVRLPQVTIRPALLEAAARLSLLVGVDGHRADLLMAKTAATLAAFEERSEVEPSDLERVAPLVFRHRLKRRPFEDRTLDVDELTLAVREAVAGSPPSEAKKANAGPRPR